MGGAGNGIAYHGGFIPYVGDVPRRSATTCAARSGSRPCPGSTSSTSGPHDSVGPRRGRADAPAGRALRGAAGDPQPVVRPARRRERGQRPRGRWRWSGATARSALALTRQKLPRTAETAERAREGVRRGGYVLREAIGGRARIDLILIATGSELAARDGGADAARGRRASRTRVVSLPCWERFDAPGRRPTATRSCRPPSRRRRRRSRPASRWAGSAGSATRAPISRPSTTSARRRPAATIFEHFGFTADRVAEIARWRRQGRFRGRVADASMPGHQPPGRLATWQRRTDAHRVRGRPRRRRPQGRAPAHAPEHRPGARLHRPRRRRQRPGRRLSRLRRAGSAGRSATGDVERGHPICGSGVGAAVAASKMRGIRGVGLPRHVFGAPGRRARRHERPRLGARVIGIELALSAAGPTWARASPAQPAMPAAAQGPRHRDRGALTRASRWRGSADGDPLWLAPERAESTLRANVTKTSEVAPARAPEEPDDAAPKAPAGAAGWPRRRPARLGGHRPRTWPARWRQRQRPGPEAQAGALGRQAAWTTRSARACASSGCPIRASSSSSARPATSPTARSSRRSTSSGGRTCCRTSSRSSRSAGDRTPTRRSATEMHRPRSTSTAASSRSTRQSGTSSPSGSTTSRATSTTRRLYDRLAEAPRHARRASTARRGNRLFYLATQPSAFADIVGELGRVGPRPRAPRRRLAADRHREAVRPRPRVGRSGSTARSARSSARRRSTASTTTWARRPSGTCSSSGSATGSSSRSGTAATSTTCRSRWPSRSASRTAARSTRRPARSATSSRTTCCSC